MQLGFIQLGGFNRPYQKRRQVIVLSVIIAVVMLSIGGYLTYQHLHKQVTPTTPAPGTNVPPQDVLALVETVGQYVQNLPGNELPTVATITDTSKLDQEFFVGAQSGDKVLIYSNARRAILYRPSTKEVIRQGRVDLQNDKSASPSASTTASGSAEPVLRVKF